MLPVATILGPAQFGLDDTHMPCDVWPISPVRFGRLVPGAAVTITVEGFGTRAKFDGPPARRVEVTYRLDEAESDNGHRTHARLQVGWIHRRDGAPFEPTDMPRRAAPATSLLRIHKLAVARPSPNAVLRRPFPRRINVILGIGSTALLALVVALILMPR